METQLLRFCVVPSLWVLKKNQEDKLSGSIIRTRRETFSDVNGEYFIRICKVFFKICFNYLSDRHDINKDNNSGYIIPFFDEKTDSVKVRL